MTEKIRHTLRRWLSFPGAGVLPVVLIVGFLCCGCAGEEVKMISVSALASEKEQETGEEAAAATQEPESEAKICVYVCGEVRHKGVYLLPEGARLKDALDAAGGLTPDADEEWHNLARTVRDGEQIVFLSKEETEQARSRGFGAEGSGGLPGAKDPDGKVNLNTAGKEELLSLPGIGDAKAEAILGYREEHGMFLAAEEIMKVNGIKGSVYAKIKDLITV